eukprot:gnl/TRDRNA2_/TRDRNA2_177028_c0_seq1.p1 gnl/TRDRNA2_/TRDRNA2_177028_c0~~gnl/TRDRNA2_/TRDRNA2_177028_c0_seq1.p1  ORF type:complete len:567 (+),score=50.37 gnl/TRDRNA2_/TRDRNA2_177028_c0_seq1:56-1756(+)
MEPPHVSQEAMSTVGVALSFSVLVLGNYVLLHLYSFFGDGFSSRLKVVIKDPIGAVSGLMHRLVQLTQPQNDGSLLESQLALVMAKRKIERLASLMRFGLHYAAFMTVINLVSIVVVEDSMIRSTVLQDTIRFAFGFFIFQAFFAFPQYLTAYTMQILSLANTLRMIGFIVASPNQQNLVDMRQALNIMRSMDMAFMGGDSLSVLRHVVVCVIECGAFMQHKWDRNMTYLSASSFILQELLTASLILYVSSLYWSGLQAEMRATLQNKESSQAKETVQSLLSVMCDAVVHLNTDLQICGPTPKLAALLLHNQSLDGRSFLGLMPATDSERFLSHVCGTEPKNHAQSLNVQLKDSSGDFLEVRMFHASFRDLIGGQGGHVIGLSDLSAQDESSRPPQEAIADEMHVVSPGCVGSASARSSSSWGDEASDVVMPLANAALRDKHPEVTVSFDALTADLQIIDYSKDFTFLCNPQSEESGLLPLIKEGDRFFKWLQDHVNAFMNDRSPPSEHTFKVHLRTAFSVSRGVEFSALCSITLKADVHPDSEEEEMIVACARLTRLKCRSLRAR